MKTIRQSRRAERDLHTLDKENEFVFNTIADNNEKETHSISIDNSLVLMNRLDELAKAAINRKTQDTVSKTAGNSTAERTDALKR